MLSVLYLEVLLYMECSLFRGSPLYGVSSI